MRKGAGISGLTRHTAATSSYNALSTALTAQQVGHLETSLASFRDALVTFAAQHRADIRKDPALRHQFQKMCAAIGVDPLAGSSGRGAWWSEQLGLGEWSCELALQVVDVCVSTRERNGGIIEMSELIARVERMRGGAAADKITEDDIRRAVDLLAPLHAGYTLHSAGGTTFVRSVPRELDTDQSMLLVLASDTGGALTEADVRERTGWPQVRARTALDDCVMREGLGWVDEQASQRTVYLIAAVDFADV
ncbi:Vacuolar-sorting protein SNF8 [Vanrija pseudolonga]|uniref:Vacuolar-sorting protein SNF8 n=1 Tax=Vanrija pseudolonga TaxID=143232 RepID=A0AAF0Y5I7_9TREE|nr:Vacuolar-sorting protein SNF8 [Vanrija pseudolonga]